MKKLVLVAGLILAAAACGGDDTAEELTTTVTSAVTTTLVTSDDTVTTTTATPAVEETPTVEEGDSAEEASDEADPSSAVDTTTSTRLAPELTPGSEVTLRALGPVRIGMSVDEASDAARLSLVRDPDRASTDACHYVTAGDSLPGISFMVLDGLIVRIEIDAPSNVSTRSGVQIGSPSEYIERVYAGNIQAAPASVSEGDALAFVPNDDFDADFRIYFEIADGTLSRYRFGTRPAIDSPSGCT